MKKILIVDDEPDLVTVLKSVLEQKKFHVFSATDGQEGIDTAKQIIPDLIILDVAMPKMDGYEFVRYMKSEESIRNIPVVMVTANANLDELFKIEGVHHYFTKPYNTEELLTAIDSILQINRK